MGQFTSKVSFEPWELKGNKDDYSPDIEASMGTFDFIMDALKSLSKEYIEAVIDNPTIKEK